jgi:hypothetical protein
LTPPLPTDGLAMAMAVALGAVVPTFTRTDALETNGEGPTVSCWVSEVRLFFSVSVAIRPPMFPETTVTTANPERVVVVLWAKTPSRFPVKQIKVKTRTIERKTSPRFRGLMSARVQSRVHTRCLRFVFELYVEIGAMERIVTQKKLSEPGTSPSSPHSLSCYVGEQPVRGSVHLWE